MGDDNHVAFYIDGEVTRVTAFKDFRMRFEDDQPAVIANSNHPAMELSEVRYFADRLTQPEIKEMYDEWLAVRDGECVLLVIEG